MNAAGIGPQTPIWDAAFRTHRDQWVRLATRWVGELKAEGLVEELLTRWWEDGRTFGTPLHLHRLMCATIPNRALDRLRTTRRQVPAPPDELPAAAQPRATASSSPDAPAQVEQIAEAVWPVVLAALSSSSYPQAQAFVLRVGCRMKPREIAEFQGTTANAVGTRITRVKRQITKDLDTAFPEGSMGVNDEVCGEVFLEISVRLASLDRYITEAPDGPGRSGAGP